MTTVSRTSGTTKLVIGEVSVPIGLYKVTTDSTKRRKWETADAEGNPWNPTASAGEATQGDPLSEGSVITEKLGESAVPPAPAPVGGAVPPAGSSPPAGGEEPEAEEVTLPRKGIRKDDGSFVDLTDQIEEIAERATLEEMRILSFIDARHVPRERIIAAYYLAAGTGDASHPPTRVLATLMRAMRATSKVAVVRFSKRKGQTLGILTARRDGALVLLEVAFSAQVREPNGKCLAHSRVEALDSDIHGAVELITAMAGKRDSLDGIRDARLVMEEELVSRAEAGELDEYELAPELLEVDGEIGRLGQLLAAAA